MKSTPLLLLLAFGLLFTQCQPKSQCGNAHKGKYKKKQKDLKSNPHFKM